MSAKTLSEKTITLVRVRVRVRVRARVRVRSVVGGGDHLVAARLVEAHQGDIGEVQGRSRRDVGEM